MHFHSRLLRRAALCVFLCLPAMLPVGAQPAPAPNAAAQTASVPALAAAPELRSLPAIQAPTVNGANPYGLQALWAQGDWVARTTLVILVIMSVASWYVLLTKLVAQTRMGGQGKHANQSFWAADTVRQGADTLQEGSPYRFIAESALEATRKHDGLIGQVDLNTWVTQSIERAVNTIHSRTQEGLAVLATVGSTAPFVGLFGTVWGIMNSFIGISEAHTTNLAVVAPGIAEALLATALGLVAAIPAVVIYNHLTRTIAAHRALLGDASAMVLLLISREGDRGSFRLARAAE
jgi:biopolymer transport protein ExbB